MWNPHDTESLRCILLQAKMINPNKCWSMGESSLRGLSTLLSSDWIPRLCFPHEPKYLTGHSPVSFTSFPISYYRFTISTRFHNHHLGCLFFVLLPSSRLQYKWWKYVLGRYGWICALLNQRFGDYRWVVSRKWVDDPEYKALFDN